MTSLFDEAAERRRAELAPLAERLRPTRLDEVVGQQHLIGPEGPLRALVSAGRLPSMILWGPAGTGKTTLARLLAAGAGYQLVGLSAVSSGVREVREEIDHARRRLGETGGATALFIDEIHRFNRAQQDLLLPAVERGDVVLLGATTENPYFEVNAPLLSRCTLWRLHPLTPEDLATLAARGARAQNVTLTAAARDELVAFASGDARALLTTLEAAAVLAAPHGTTVDAVHVRHARDQRLVRQSRDTHYDQVSALIKSVRGSDPDAALYWLATMLESGESARYVARRLVILASEDVGLADPQALVLAEAAARAIELVGLPEGALILAHAAVALALAPKSNTVTRALGAATAAVRARAVEVPDHLRSSGFAGAATEGFGVGYRYPHDDPRGWVDQEYLPDEVPGRPFYVPGSHGAEGPAAARWRARRDGSAEPPENPPVE